MPEPSLPVLETVNADAARQRWHELLSNVSHRHVRVVVEESGVPVAAVVSIHDLERLRALEHGSAVDEARGLSAEEAAIHEETLARNRATPVDLDALFAPPTPEQTAKRMAVLAQIERHLPQRVITPLTAADLIHEARAREEEAYGTGR